jgi:hypothetical protein
VTLQDLVLKCPGIFFGNASISEYSETSVDAVHGPLLADDILNMLLALLNFFYGRRRKRSFDISERKLNGYFRSEVIRPVIEG